MAEVREAMTTNRLRTIERIWTGPMANDTETRVRFAMWDALRFAASLADGRSRKAITDALRRDERLFDASGHVRKCQRKPQ